MLKTIKTRAGREIIMPTSEEDAAITAAALSDPDALPITEDQLKAIRKRGRPKVDNPKASLNMRIDADVLKALRSSGTGWQTRVNLLLREAVNAGKL